MQSDNETCLDILRGVPAIARFVGLNDRQTYHALQNKHIPAIKEGAVWVTTKTRLRRHYNGGDEDGAPENKAPENKDSAGLIDLAAVAPSKRGEAARKAREPR